MEGDVFMSVVFSLTPDLKTRRSFTILLPRFGKLRVECDTRPPCAHPVQILAFYRSFKMKVNQEATRWFC